MTERNTGAMSGYPIQLITDYRAGKVSRQQFMKQFSDWQKPNGINYDCKGTADKHGVYMTYREVRAEITGGILRFFADGWKTAESAFEFRRKVDFSMNRRKTWN